MKTIYKKSRSLQPQYTALNEAAKTDYISTASSCDNLKASFKIHTIIGRSCALRRPFIKEIYHTDVDDRQVLPLNLLSCHKLHVMLVIKSLSFNISSWTSWNCVGRWCPEALVSPETTINTSQLAKSAQRPYISLQYESGLAYAVQNPFWCTARAFTDYLSVGDAFNAKSILVVKTLSFLQPTILAPRVVGLTDSHPCSHTKAFIYLKRLQ